MDTGRGKLGEGAVLVSAGRPRSPEESIGVASRDPRPILTPMDSMMSGTVTLEGPVRRQSHPHGCLDVLGAVFCLGPSRVTLTHPHHYHDHDQDHHHHYDNHDDGNDDDEDVMMMMTTMITTMITMTTMMTMTTTMIKTTTW